MSDINVYFSDCFHVDPAVIEDYGAINISLINDMPLFIDPFLLFNSRDPEFQKIHQDIIDYLRFLQDNTAGYLSLKKGMKAAWFTFSEVKQTWLGFSLSGNSGRGMGNDFAQGLFKGLTTIYKNLDKSTVTETVHIEKLCLICPKVGRDKISDFTTAFTKKYLLEYTEIFAKKYIAPELRRNVTVDRAYFDWDLKVWVRRVYDLPYINGDYVLLTPKAILTRDDTFINRSDMLEKLDVIGQAVPDEQLRFQLNTYLAGMLTDRSKRPSKKEKLRYAQAFVNNYPEIIDYYLRYKEEHKEEATSISQNEVYEVEHILCEQASGLINLLAEQTDFYNLSINVYDEVTKRIQYLKHVIEDQDGYKLFYEADGTPIKRESILQTLFRLVWYGTKLDVNREVNNGRGPVDYKISFGKKGAVLVEFKLASNSKLKQNMANQVEVYKAASESDSAIKVILYFTDQEQKKIYTVLNELGLAENNDIVLIDARPDKISASNVK